MNSLDIHSAGLPALPALPFGEKAWGRAAVHRRTRHLRDSARVRPGCGKWNGPSWQAGSSRSARRQVTLRSTTPRRRRARASRCARSCYAAGCTAAASDVHARAGPGAPGRHDRLRDRPDCVGAGRRAGVGRETFPGLAAAGRSGTWESLSPRSGHGLSMSDSSAAVAAYAAAGADAASASAGEGGAPALPRLCPQRRRSRHLRHRRLQRPQPQQNTRACVRPSKWRCRRLRSCLPRHPPRLPCWPCATPRSRQLPCLAQIGLRPVRRNRRHAPRPRQAPPLRAGRVPHRHKACACMRSGRSAACSCGWAWTVAPSRWGAGAGRRVLAASPAARPGPAAQQGGLQRAGGIRCRDGPGRRGPCTA